METNPIINDVKVGDLILIEIQSSERSAFKQIIKITECNLLPADEKYSFAWLDFKATIEYTNYRLHQTMLDKPSGNCLSFTEIIPLELLETLVRNEGMWKASLYLMSDNELAAKQKRHFY